MNLKKVASTIYVFLFIVSTAFSQNKKMLDSLPKTKADYIRSEPEVINTIDWLENSPVNQQVARRKQLNANFLAWLANSPKVTIDVNEKITSFSKKNPELLFIFMGGWTKYSLQNAYSKDALKCNMAGIKSSIKVYQMGNGLSKDKEMENIIAMDSKNELEGWVKSQLGQK